MEEVKNIFGIVATALTFVGYIPYIKDTLKGKTKPHIYTWFLWALISFVAFGLQLYDGGGIGSYVTLAAALVCFFIFLLGCRIGEKDITKTDTILLAFALLAVIMWPLSNQPLLSVIILAATDMLSFIPTIRKSWNKPYTETLSSYWMNTFRFSLGLVALQNYTVITTLYPLTWLIANGLFSIFLIIRRRKMRSK